MQMAHNLLELMPSCKCAVMVRAMFRPNVARGTYAVSFRSILLSLKLASFQGCKVVIAQSVAS